MDSVTQFALGAGIGLVVLGPRMGARKAALTGGILGSLPDADVFLSYADPVESFIGHRGFSHSLLMHVVATPILGEGLRLIVRSLRQDRLRAWLAGFLCLTTHALLDGLTIYGTKLFWPVSQESFGLGSIFIIDPLYTLPLLMVVLWALVLGRYGPALKRATVAALAVSTTYLGWSVAGQQIAENRAERFLAAAGVSADPMMGTPTPFNTLFWRIMAIDGERYFSVYVPLLGGDDAVTAYVHPRHMEVAACLGDGGTLAALVQFTDGFYRFLERDGLVILADLRMGLPPVYAFRFALAEDAGGSLRPIPPRRIDDGRESVGDREWLKAGMLGRKAIRPAEADHLFSPATAGAAEAGASAEIAC